MGISGLLPFVKNACRPANIRDFKGCTVAIDGYSWLHKGAFSCAEKIVKGEKTDGYIYYCIKQINMLLDAGVKPIMVFDGCNLESKAVTEKKRRANREKTKQKGKEFLCEGKIKEARECFQRCVDVTPEMAMEVIEACHKKKVDCIVAPYEADAQLAYLHQIQIADIIITEDSDLILFGCNKILFKMDSNGGGQLYEKENLAKVFGKQAEKMSFEKFRYMCILSGCDYLPSLPGIGLAKAFKFFTLTNNPDLQHVLTRIPNYLRMPNLTVPSDYIESFIKANKTFLYQLVFCPKKKSLVPLNSYPDDVNSSELEYAGKYFSNDLAYQFAMGKISVKELQRLKSSDSQISSADFPNISHINGLWSTEEDTPKHISQNTKTFIKFTPSSAKICAKKRTLNQSNQDTSSSEDKILSSYFSETPPSKKAKINTSPVLENSLNESNENKTPHAAFVPFRKTLTTDSTNVSESLKDLRKVVRSRFFVAAETVVNNEKHSLLLDSIDKEYQNTSEKLSNLEEERDSGIVEDDCDISQYFDSSCKENVDENQTLDTVDNSHLDEGLCSEDMEMNSFDNSISDDLDLRNDSQPTSSVESPQNNILNKFSFQSSSSAKKKTPSPKCPRIGLSKKQQSKTGKAIVDTLFNFKFTKLSKVTLS